MCFVIRISIPNPERAKDTAEVILHKCEYKEGQNSFYCVEREKEPTYDLSFLGLKNRVYVTKFAVGNITGDGDCLVLALEEKLNKKVSENYSYLAVLDYKNKKVIWEKQIMRGDVRIKTVK